MNIYAQKGWLVYDPFMGSGTTALACKKMGLGYIGSEISTSQVEYAEKRLTKSIDEIAKN
jgi:DNA modification methylase